MIPHRDSAANTTGCRLDFSDETRSRLRCDCHQKIEVLLVDGRRRSVLRELLVLGYLTGRAREEAREGEV